MDQLNRRLAEPPDVDVAGVPADGSRGGQPARLPLRHPGRAAGQPGGRHGRPGDPAERHRGAAQPARPPPAGGVPVAASCGAATGWRLGRDAAAGRPPPRWRPSRREPWRDQAPSMPAGTRSCRCSRRSGRQTHAHAGRAAPRRTGRALPAAAGSGAVAPETASPRPSRFRRPAAADGHGRLPGAALAAMPPRAGSADAHTGRGTVRGADLRADAARAGQEPRGPRRGVGDADRRVRASAQLRRRRPARSADPAGRARGSSTCARGGAPPAPAPAAAAPAPAPAPAARRGRGRDAGGDEPGHHAPAAAPATAAAESGRYRRPRQSAEDRWRTAADEGWQRAMAAAEPVDAGTTRSGLPKRVPQAQLVPGGVQSGPRNQNRRSPDEVRGLLSAYHRGVQRGRTDGSAEVHRLPG